MTLRTARMTSLVAVVLLTPYFAAGAAPTPSPATTPPTPAVPPSPPPPRDNPDPWAKLCDPGIKWELEPLPAGKRTKKTGHEWPIIRIESANPREIAGVKVCRLKWYLVEEGKKPIDFDSKKMKKMMDLWGDSAPSWYDAQGALKRARLVAITSRGLLVLQMEGQGAPSEREIEKGLAKDWVSFPGVASSQSQKQLFRKGGSQQWSFDSSGGETWCYGYRQIPCMADDSTCHAGACFERGHGLVTLYIDTGARSFPEEFTFFNLIGFPEHASWRYKPLPSGQ